MPLKWRQRKFILEICCDFVCGAVVGVHMPPDLLVSTVEASVPWCGAHSSLHCYLLDDGALILYSSEEHKVSAL